VMRSPISTWRRSRSQPRARPARKA
jgi:hypothetical protein